MSHLTGMLLLYMDVYDTFVCLCNLLHRRFFLTYCRMDTIQLNWRLQYFDQLIHTHLPQLHQHLYQLNLPCSEYLIDWCRSLFTRVLPLDVSSRVIDWYLLDGEIICYRVSAAILHYYRRQLVRSTYDECIFLLCNVDHELHEVEFWNSVSIMSGNNVIHPLQFKQLLDRHTDNSTKSQHGFSIDQIKL